MRRTSHALAVAGRVWLIDPVDTPELEGRVRARGEPAGVLQLLDRHERGCSAWAERLGVPHIRAWEGLGAAPFEALPVRRRRWWHEVALWEPTLARVAPERILCGHGAGVHDDAVAALQEALQTARRRLPAAWFSAIRAVFRSAA